MNDKCKHGIELSTVCKDCDDEQADLIITKGLTKPPNNTPRTDKEQISVTTALMRYGERKRVVPAEVVKAIELELTEALKNYNELLYAVARKFPNETRHQTALRYIHEAEQSVLNADSTAQQEKDKPYWNDEVDKTG